MQDQHQHSITRSACAAYLASFLARAAFLPHTLVLHALEQLTGFCSDYCRYVCVYVILIMFFVVWAQKEHAPKTHKQTQAVTCLLQFLIHTSHFTQPCRNVTVPAKSLARNNSNVVLGTKSSAAAAALEAEVDAINSLTARHQVCVYGDDDLSVTLQVSACVQLEYCCSSFHHTPTIK